jgi:CelD/BcsL family acetyltransferase involved in cellulose biosynthesis
MSRVAALPRVTQRDTHTAHQPSLRIETRSDVNWSPADLAAIDAMLDERPHVAAFLTRAWLSGLIALPPRGFDPVVVVFREGGVLRGLVPLAIRQTFAGTRVTLLGGGDRSDRVDLLAARGYEPVLADMLLEWLDGTFGRSGYVLALRDVPADSPLWAAIRRAIDEKQRPFVLVPSEVHAAPYLVLDEQDAGSQHERAAKAQSVARQRAHLERRGRITVDTLQAEPAVLDALQTLTRLLHARWDDGRSVLDNPRTVQFHQHVLPLLLAEGRLRMMQMCADGRPIAVCYLLVAGTAQPRNGEGSWCGYLLAGYDREWAGRIHLGRLVVVTAMELAARAGAREFDFLKGSERFKYYWPVRERVCIDADLYSGSPRTHVSRARLQGRHVAASLLKSVRGLFESHF